MLTREQYNKLQGLGLTTAQVNQVVNKAGGVEKKWSPLGFGVNTVKSAANLVGSTAKAVLNPFETVKNIISLAKDPKVVIDYYKQRYGKDLLETLYTDPAGVAADLSVLLGGVGGVAKLGGASKVAKVASTASKFADPLSLVGMGTKQALKAGGKAIGGVTSKAGESFLTSGLHNRELLRGARGVQGGSLGPLYEKYNLFDKSSSTFAEALDKVAGSRKNIAQYSNKPIKLADIDKELSKVISKLRQEKSPEAAQEIASILAGRKRLNQIAGGADYVTVAQSDLLRSQIDKRIPKTAFGMGLKTSAKVSGKKTIRDILKTKQNLIEPKLKQLGLDESALIKLKEAAEKTEGNRSGNLNFGLLKTLSGFGGYSAGGVPGALAGVAIEQIANSPFGSRVAYKTLSGASKLPEKVSPVFSKASNVGRNVVDYGKYARVPSKITKQTGEDRAQPAEMQVPLSKAPKRSQSQELSMPYQDYTPSQYTGPIKYKSPKLKSNVFQSRKLTRSSSY